MTRNLSRTTAGRAAMPRAGHRGACFANARRLRYVVDLMVDEPMLPPAMRPAGPPPLLAMRKTLADLEAAVVAAGGSASPRVLLADMARRLAFDVAGYFDELPMQLFTGHVPRVQGPMRHLLPVREIPHRALLGRYRSVSHPISQRQSKVRYVARVAILGVGVDGMLRTGEWMGFVLLPDAPPPSGELLPWSHPQLRGVPDRHLRFNDWRHASDGREVAEPAEVIVALKQVASGLAAAAARDLALIQQFF